MNQANNLYAAVRAMIREEIDRTPGFRELTGRPDLPASVEAEKTILGAILLDNAAHAEANVLMADDFSLESHRLIFLRMSQLIDAGVQADIVTLGNKLRDEREIETVGGVAYLAYLTEGLPRRPVIGNYIDIVKDKARLRRIMGASVAAIKACQDQQKTAADIVAQLGVALKGIRKGK